MSVEPVPRGTRANPSKRRPTSRIPYLLAVLVILAATAAVYWLRPGPPPPPNLAVVYAEIAPFDRLESVGTPGWVGVFAPGAPTDPKALDTVCKKLTEALHPGPGQDITLLGSEGVGVRTCGDDPARK